MAAGAEGPRPRFHPETELILYDAYARFRPLDTTLVKAIRDVFSHDCARLEDPPLDAAAHCLRREHTSAAHVSDAAFHRPTGVRRHLHMLSIVAYVSESMENRRPSVKEMWEHLESMYDIEGLSEMEEDVFSSFEGEFALPEAEYGALMDAKRAAAPSAEDGESPVVCVCVCVCACVRACVCLIICM
eukprot:Opistho-1_new@43183